MSSWEAWILLFWTVATIYLCKKCMDLTQRCYNYHIQVIRLESKIRSMSKIKAYEEPVPSKRHALERIDGSHLYQCMDCGKKNILLENIFKEPCRSNKTPRQSLKDAFKRIEKEKRKNQNE